ncbi:MAG: glycosyltransferase family 4 protein, partial [Anaerolineaceae bacterium]|nr:glycosyltransferase family 4 protein [Anaerolineaceae bacterium]
MGKKIIYDSHESYQDMLEGTISKLLKKLIAVFETLLLAQVDVVITVGSILREPLSFRGAK